MVTKQTIQKVTLLLVYLCFVYHNIDHVESAVHGDAI